MLLISSLLSPLLLTIIIELVVALLFSYKKKVEIITVILINIITNPILNFSIFINLYFSFINTNLPIIAILLELLVVYVEWKLLFYALQEKPKKLLLLSFTMNLCSFLTGVLLFNQLGILF